MKNLLFLVTFTTVTFFSLKAQEKSADILFENFFSKYKKSPKSALTYLFNTNPAYYEKNKESVDKFINGYGEEYLPKIGKYHGYAKPTIKDEVFYDSLIKHSFVLSYDDLPLLFEITLYKPNNLWVLYNFTYKTNYGLPQVNEPKE